jgi:hypothetical protein
MFHRIWAVIKRFFQGPAKPPARPITNTVLQVDDGVIGPQSDHLELNPKGSVDSLKVTLTKDEVKNG